MNEITTNGIVLSSSPMGEYDRRIELLTADLGRISAFARGARKPGSSLLSVTRAFAFGTFHLYQGKNSYSVNSAVITHYFEELAADLEDTAYGFYFLEVARYFSRENVKADDMLALLYYSLRALSIASLSKRLVRCVFEIKMLELNGLCPAPERLFAGTGNYSFGADKSPGCRKAFTFVYTSPISGLYTFILTEEVLLEFESVSRSLMALNVDRPFQSLKMLEI